MTLDKDAVILGEKNGRVIYRAHTQRKIVLDSDGKKSNQASGAQLSDSDVSLDSFLQKINCATRVNQSWIVTGDEAGAVAFWYVNQTRPSLGKSFPVSGPVIDLVVRGCVHT